MQSCTAGCDGNSNQPLQDDNDSLERLDIVWPSKRFMPIVLTDVSSLRSDKKASPLNKCSYRSSLLRSKSIMNRRINA